MSPIRFTIKGQPCSKANSREIAHKHAKKDGKLVLKGGKPVKVPFFRKSDDAIAYENNAVLQIPHWAKQMLDGPIKVTLHLYYESNQPDLDESIVLDVMQTRFAPVEEGQKGKPRPVIRKGVYINDRQVREKHVYHHVDPRNPRAEIEVEALQPQQVGLLGFDIGEAGGDKTVVAKVERTPKGVKVHSVAEIPKGKDPF